MPFHPNPEISKSKFSFCFEGKNEIDASLLSNTIKDIVELTKLATKEEAPDADIKLNVSALMEVSKLILIQ